MATKADDNLFSSFFWGNSPNINQQLRQRIALQMMGQRKGYPKNIGEGLTAIGDSLGEMGLARRLEQGDLAQQEAAKGIVTGVTGGGGTTGYAPPDSVPPAVAAINRAINPVATDERPTEEPVEPQPSLLSTVPQQPPSVLNPAPMRGLGGTSAQGITAAQAGSLMSPKPTLPPAGRVQPTAADGGYNSIDAQAGVPLGRRMPGRLQNVIEGREADPDMQAYYGQLAAGEARSNREVSPTGAGGSWQFTRGTGAQYGIPGDKRFDDDLSMDATQRLTRDNADVFQRINGRPPTMAELAVMHQQGGQTGAKMMAGTGNAPPANLAVNNINPSAGPAQAVNAIKGYYGMPERPVDPRAAIAQTLLARQGGPQPNPMSGGPRGPSSEPSAPPPGGGPDQRLAFSGIEQAPPVPSNLRQAPPVQGAQASNPYAAQRPVAPTPSRMSDDEIKIRQTIIDNQNNPYVAQRLAAPLKQLEDARTAEDARRVEEYKSNLQNFNQLDLKRREYQANTPQRNIELGQKGSEAAIKAEEADIYQRTGKSPKEFYDEMDKEKASVAQTIKAQGMQQLARKAIRAGVITGYGANGILASAKFADWAWKNGLKGDLAANTEIMSAALKSGLSEAIKTVNGEGGVGVSNTDVRIAEGIVGSDPNLQLKTIKTIMDRAAEINYDKINRYDRKVEKYLSGHQQEMNYVPAQTGIIPHSDVEKLVEGQKDNVKGIELKTYFDQTYGPGAAEFVLKRAERFRRRQQRQGTGD